MNAAARLLNQGVLSRGWVISIFLHRSQMPLVVVAFGVLMSALSVIYITNNVRSLNANIEQTLIERQQLHVQRGQLLLEKSTWIMQARIQHVAEGKLGMMIPDHKSVVVVNE
jgi:cell division protein FtsL